MSVKSTCYFFTKHLFWCVFLVPWTPWFSSWSPILESTETLLCLKTDLDLEIRTFARTYYVATVWNNMFTHTPCANNLRVLTARFIMVTIFLQRLQKWWHLHHINTWCRTNLLTVSQSRDSGNVGKGHIDKMSQSFLHNSKFSQTCFSQLIIDWIVDCMHEWKDAQWHVN